MTNDYVPGPDSRRKVPPIVTELAEKPGRESGSFSPSRQNVQSEYSPSTLSPNTLSATAPFRRHSRKKSKSSQVLVPPIVPSSKTHNGLDGTEETPESEDGVEKTTAPTASRMVSGASFLIFGQFFAKLITFSLNQALLKFVNPEVMGVNVQLELLVNTIVYFSREAIRLATQRQTMADKKPDGYRFEGGVVQGTRSGTAQLVINIGFVPILVGIPLAGLLALLYWSSTSLASQPHIGLAIAIYAVAAVVELLSEPSFVLAQLQLELKQRAAFESIAITARCILTFLLVLSGKSLGYSMPVIAYAFGQLAYSSVVSGQYIVSGVLSARRHQGAYKVLTIQPVWSDPPADTMSAAPQKQYFDANTTKLAISLWLQTIFKHCLNEGDKLLVSLLLPISEQGVYAVVVNYGSLLARLVFSPVEEAIRSVFSKMLSPATISPQNQKLFIDLFSRVLRIYIYLSVFATIFGPAVSYMFLRLAVSQTWLETNAAQVLATYACYIPFMALNGVLEAVVQSVATSQEIKRQGYVMIAFSLSFALAAYIFMGLLNLGATGLVYAGMINMLLRIMWCVQFISAYFRRRFGPTQTWVWLLRGIPNKTSLAATIVAATGSRLIGTALTLSQLAQQVGISLLLLTAILYSERELIASLATGISSKLVQKQKKA